MLEDRRREEEGRGGAISHLIGKEERFMCGVKVSPLHRRVVEANAASAHEAKSIVKLLGLPEKQWQIRKPVAAE
jgi:hypothetical protein